jgi:3-dehydroquinate synthase|tara:strand:+ start:2061 stop:3146 length:1086 start_codon:yes stop_codon:yes gene_type:complete
MKTINIDLGDRSYPIYVGDQLIDNPTILLNHIHTHTVVVVTNTTVAPLYLDTVTQSLGDNTHIIPIILPDGEQYKNTQTLNTIYEVLLKNKCDREVMLIALGGGVIGDITGFAAASFMRGVKFIQIPTTLLSQVDSSVGGKTGINHALGKNMIGAFYQPQCVIADVGLLKTLPDRELSAGLAEVIKYGLIRDAAFFVWLEKTMPSLINKDPSTLIEAVIRSCENKADVVAQDEFESSKGIRATLNLGHTFGHAIEHAMGYGNWLHGEAVAAGMVMAAFLSQELGWLNPDEFDRTKQLIANANLPINPPDIPVDQFMGLMQSDKKSQRGRIHLILQKTIGDAILTSDYPEAALRKTLQQKSF